MTSAYDMSPLGEPERAHESEPDLDAFPADLDDADLDSDDATIRIDQPDGDQLNLADRQALRRVAEAVHRARRHHRGRVPPAAPGAGRLDRGVWTEGTASEAGNSLAELALAETAGSQVLEGLIQRRDKPDPATYIGSGKARELQIVVSSGADTVICDGELTPGQLRQLEDVVKVKVIDRTALILDIFAQHAKSREGKAQVALARMAYMLPR